MEQFVADLNLYTVAFLLIAGFIACFIDSTVGGGGLISTPALLALALPAAVTKSQPMNKKPKIKKEPVPGPKKPS